MAMYRCAVCGSPNVTKSEGNSSFSYSKAIVGTVAFGPVGAVAGINGKKTSVYTCADCGNSLPQPMDNITKDKIDLVMTNSDLLASKIYPTIFSDYTYLRKEKEALNRAAVEKSTTFSMNYANPLEISEKDFRHAAKAARLAFQQLVDCRNALWKGMSDEPQPSKLVEAREKITDMNAIVEGLRSLRTIVYGITTHSSIVIDDIMAVYTGSGLQDSELLADAIIYILMENGGKMTLNDFYSIVVCNPVYQQAFRIIMGRHYQLAASTRQAELWEQGTSFTAKEEKHIWFRALNALYFYAKNLLINAPSMLRGWEEEFFDSKIWEFPFRLVNNSLYIPNFVSAEEQFIKDMPETAQSLAKAQQEIEQLESNIRELSNSEPTQVETTAQRNINQLRRANTEMDMQIAKLRKKFFGKKKAAVEIQELETKTKENLQQITENNNLIEEARKQHASEIKEKRSLIEEQLSNARRSLDGLQEKKSSYIQQYPQWVCLAGVDSEICSGETPNNNGK